MVSFVSRGNEFKGKYFVSLSAWKIEPIAGGATAAEPDDEVPFGEEPSTEEDRKGLPF